MSYQHFFPILPPSSIFAFSTVFVAILQFASIGMTTENFVFVFACISLFVIVR